MTIEDAQAWHKIQSVLEDRVKAGVDVRVFYDDMGSIGFINTDFIKKMEKVGIHCRVFNPFTPGLNVFLNNRDHRKITVIDGKVGFTGGTTLLMSILISHILMDSGRIQASVWKARLSIL